MRWRRPLLIYLAAWAVRLIHVAQIRRTPFFDDPLADGARRDSAFAGLAWGLAAMATPNILLAVPPAALWVLRRRRRGDAGTRMKAGAAALFLLGVAAPVLLV